MRPERVRLGPLERVRRDYARTTKVLCPSMGPYFARERRVYGGRATSFTDRQLRNGVPYRYRIVSLDRAGNRSRGVAKTALPQVIVLFSPAAAARVQAAPLLRWLPSRGAPYYNVQLFRGSQKVLSAWPKQPRLALGSKWKFAGRPMTLRPGTYRWYVWPGIGARSQARYGRMLGQSTFVVRA